MPPSHGFFIRRNKFTCRSDKEQRQIPHADEHGEEAEVVQQKFDEIFSRLPRIEAAERIQCNETCERGDGRSQSARVDRDEQRGIILRKFGEKHRRWHIGDELTGKRADRERIQFDEPAQPLGNGRDAREVARKDKEGAKGQKQGIVHAQQGAEIENEQPDGDRE